MANDNVADCVGKSLGTLLNSAEFVEWLKAEELRTNGFILINNSSFFRQESKTHKSPFYLHVPVSVLDGVNSKTVDVVRGLSFYTDFKYLPETKSSKLETETLSQALDRELSQLGRVVMVLIGEIHDNIRTTEAIGHSLFSELVLDRTSKASLAISGKTVTVQSAIDDESLWQELETKHGQPLPDNFISPFTAALENIRKNHYAVLELPREKVVPKSPLLDRFVTALRENASQYGSALTNWKQTKNSSANYFTEILRIAYNFANDAVRIIRLLSSVCDLKPVVRWCTVNEWFQLACAFRNLPWSKLKHKPSLNGYQQTIGGARNHAFHQLLPVESTLRTELDGAALGRVTLSLFPEYERRKSGESFEYQDRELVKILTDFTRVTERSAAPQFWERNLDVMNATIELIVAVSQSLKVLAKTQPLGKRVRKEQAGKPKKDRRG